VKTVRDFSRLAEFPHLAKEARCGAPGCRRSSGFLVASLLGMTNA
jgi:hypothetical protein